MNRHVKRVFMTADTIGGVWGYSIELARGLASEGVQTGVATMGAPLSKAQWSEAAAVPGLRIFESSYKLEWMDNPWSDVERAGDWLLTLEEEYQPDVVHLNGYVHGDLPWRAPHLVVGHSCVLSWWQAVKGESAPALWHIYRERVLRGIRAADRVIAPSRAMLSFMQHHYGQLESTVVVPNSRDPLRYVPGNKEPIIFAAGRVWDEAKNLAQLSRVAHLLNWPVYIAGDAKRPDGSAKHFPNVQMLGVLSSNEVASWLSRAAIYCLPARYEPFGLSVLEAALSGCALVLGDISSLRENWDGAAVFTTPGDDAALADGLRELIRNAGRRVSMASAALTRGRQFTTKRMASTYLDIYHELAGQEHTTIPQRVSQE